MSKTCSTHGRDEKYIQNFRGETSRGSRSRGKDSVKSNFEEM